MRPIVIIGQLLCLLVVLKPNAHWKKGWNYNRQIHKLLFQSYKDFKVLASILLLAFLSSEQLIDYTTWGVT